MQEAQPPFARQKLTHLEQNSISFNKKFQFIMVRKKSADPMRKISIFLYKFFLGNSSTTQSHSKLLDKIQFIPLSGLAFVANDTLEQKKLHRLRFK